MFTILTAWISERIITVTAVTVLTVAAVPTTLIIVSHDDHNTVAIIQPADEHSKIVLVSAVKKAGDDLILRLNTAESGCTTQVTQTVAASKLAPAKLQTQLVKAKSQIHGSVAPLVAAIKSDEDRFAHLTFVTPQDEENELAEFNTIAIIALGNGQSTGTITVTCQTVLITITETIQITIIQETPPPCKTDNELD